ncbi:MAG: hypothetical protein PHP44_05770 [Kiritimatiellae bacterium]|nr:hypothetical protein [Kiritimatiellia bacterium]
MMKMTRVFIMMCFVFATWVWSSLAGVPLLVNYQGKLSDTNGTPVTGTITIDVAVYTNATGGTAVYTENVGSVAVYQGLYSFTWGGQDLLPHLLSASALWQELIIDTETMSPRQQLVAVPYALVAKTVEDGAITTSKLADGAVTSTKLGSGAVTADAIAAGAVGSAQLASNAVTSASLADGSITQNKLAESCVAYEQLAKKYQAGKTIVTVTNGIYTSQTITFPQTFSSKPVVTVGYEKLADVYNLDGTVKLIASDTNDAQVGLTCSFYSSLVAISPLDTNAQNGTHLYSELINGRVSLSYYDEANQSLKYLRVHDINATAWTSVTIDATSGAGKYSALVNVTNLPAICYYNEKSGELKYTKLYDVNATSWSTPFVLDSGNAGAHVSSTFFLGNPAAVYYDQANNYMKFALIDDANATSWTAPTNITTSGGGAAASDTRCEGRPFEQFGVAYYNEMTHNIEFAETIPFWTMPTRILPSNPNGLTLSTASGVPVTYQYGPNYSWVNYYINYRRSDSINGTNWAATVCAASETFTYLGRLGTLIDLQTIIPSFCIVLQRDWLPDSIEFFHAADETGKTWANSTVIVTGENFSSFSSAAISNTPAIVYSKDNLPPLYFMMSSDSNGTNWSSSIEPVSLAASATQVSLADINDKPAIIYVDQFSGLYYVSANNADGASWKTPVLFQASIPTNASVRLGVINSNPAVVFYKSTNINLMIATDSAGSTWNSPLVLASNRAITELNFITKEDSLPLVTFKANGIMNYIRALTSDGTSWTAPVPVPGIDKLNVLSNQLVATYNDASGCYYTYEATNASTTNITWKGPIVLATNAGPHVSFAYGTNNGVNVVYFDDSSKSLMFKQYDENMTTWTQRVLDISADALAFQYPSLAFSGKDRGISYYDEGNGYLKYIDTAANGTSWNMTRRITGEGNQGLYSRLQYVNGRPQIFFYDATEENLKCAHDGNTTQITVNWIAVEP